MRREELSKIPQEGGTEKRGEQDKDLNKGVQAGSRGGCFKKGRGVVGIPSRTMVLILSSYQRI